jgi:hypothetical protein
MTRVDPLSENIEMLGPASMIQSGDRAQEILDYNGQGKGYIV